MTGDLIVEPATAPRLALATDQVLLERARRTGRPALHLFAFPGDVVSLGRYHAAPPAGGGDVVVARRRSGGRVAAAGAGFVGFFGARLLMMGLPEALLPPLPLPLDSVQR